jgi:hypothetical protein
LFSTARLFIKTGVLFLALALLLWAYLLVRREVEGVFLLPPSLLCMPP